MPEFDLYTVIAQGVGVIAMILAYFIYSARTRKTLITLKFVSNALWATHYFMLGAYPGAIMNVINMEMIMFGQNIKTLSFVYAFAITIVFSVIVLFMTKKPLRKIEMIESLKSVE